MNWKDKTEQEINVAVAKVKWPGCEVIRRGDIPAVMVMLDLKLVRVTFDPCNNATDAWPIVWGNGITIVNDEGCKFATTDAQQSYCPVGAFVYEAHLGQDCGPFKAAMCVYLEMNGVRV